MQDDVTRPVTGLHEPWESIEKPSNVAATRQRDTSAHSTCAGTCKTTHTRKTYCHLTFVCKLYSWVEKPRLMVCALLFSAPCLRCAS